MIIITGGAGFIGSALLWALNERGVTDIIVVDELDHAQKEKNIGHLTYEQLLGIEEFQVQLKEGVFDTKSIKTIFHLGAISSTSEQNWPRLMARNVEYSQDVIRWCVDHKVRCLYASSGQVYGLGEQGFSDDHDLFNTFKTITLYGKSKLLVDIWARDAGYLSEVVGLRYFNVFGPNEQHKEHMRSVIAKQYETIKATGTIQLFKSYRPDFKDGEQQRDFLYIKDAIAATLFFQGNATTAGVFNVGTGQAHTWNEVAYAVFMALKLKPHITYQAMPRELQAGYQYFTQADITKLTAAGFTNSWMSLEESVADYVKNYLQPDKHLGE